MGRIVQPRRDAYYLKKTTQTKRRAPSRTKRSPTSTNPSPTPNFNNLSLSSPVPSTLFSSPSPPLFDNINSSSTKIKLRRTSSSPSPFSPLQTSFSQTMQHQQQQQHEHPTPFLFSSPLAAAHFPATAAATVAGGDPGEAVFPPSVSPIPIKTEQETPPPTSWPIAPAVLDTDDARFEYGELMAWQCALARHQAALAEVHFSALSLQLVKDKIFQVIAEREDEVLPGSQQFRQEMLLYFEQAAAKLADSSVAAAEMAREFQERKT